MIVNNLLVEREKENLRNHTFNVLLRSSVRVVVPLWILVSMMDKENTPKQTPHQHIGVSRLPDRLKEQRD